MQHVQRDAAPLVKQYIMSLKYVDLDAVLEDHTRGVQGLAMGRRDPDTILCFSRAITEAWRRRDHQTYHALCEEAQAVQARRQTLLDAGASGRMETCQAANPLDQRELDIIVQGAAQHGHTALVLALGCSHGLQEDLFQQVQVPDTVAYAVLDAFMFSLDRQDALNVAAGLGLVKLCRAVLAEPQPPCAGAALCHAAGGDQPEVLHLLLHVDHESCMGFMGKALEAAAGNGSTQCLGILLRAARASRHGDLSEELLHACLAAAAGGSHTGVCVYLMYAGAGDLDQALERAAATGHFDAVKLLISKGAKDLGRALRSAAAGGQLEMCWHLINQHHGLDISVALCSAARAGRMTVVQHLVGDVPDTGVVMAAKAAAQAGHLDVMRYLTTICGANRVAYTEQDMQRALRAGHLRVFWHMLQTLPDRKRMAAMRRVLQHAHIGLFNACMSNSWDEACWFEQTIQFEQF